MLETKIIREEILNLVALYYISSLDYESIVIGKTNIRTNCKKATIEKLKYPLRLLYILWLFWTHSNFISNMW